MGLSRLCGRTILAVVAQRRWVEGKGYVLFCAVRRLMEIVEAVVLSAQNVGLLSLGGGCASALSHKADAKDAKADGYAKTFKQRKLRLVNHAILY